MFHASSTRKNYFFNTSQSVISQKRQQQSDSNQHSNSHSLEDNQKKSPNNSFQKIKKELTKKQEQNSTNFQRVHLTKRIHNQAKLRSHSISTISIPNITLSKNTISKIQPKSKQLENSINISLPLKITDKLNPSEEKLKLKKIESQNSQASTQIPKSTKNNFLTEQQPYGFVRFSQVLISSPTKNKPSANKRQSLSILKKKTALSCSKIDLNYLKYRTNTVPDKQKHVDTIQNKFKQTLQILRQKLIRRTGKRQYTYFDLVDEQKYIDDLFPANNASIFYTKSKQDDFKLKVSEKIQQETIQIGWRRLSDIFHPIKQKIVLFRENTNQKIVKNQFSVASNDFLMSFNAISNVSLFFKKIFENCQGDYEKHGIYCLKIFQENCWKSIIVDDYIPVLIHKNIKTQQVKLKPLTLDIEVSKNCDEIEIWPFLLEKAYASYYNSYESLYENFNMIDWLEEILMTPSECYHFPDNQQLNEQNVKRLQKILNQFPISQSIIIGFKVKTAQPCIIEKKTSKNNPQIQDVIIKTLKSQRKMKIKNLFQIFHTFYLFMPFTFKYFNTSPGNFMKASKKIVQHPMSKIKVREQIIVRSIVVGQQGVFSISLRQKQKRFYNRNIKKYQYLWMRMILIQKQFNNTYRWIQGQYSNSKSINFNLYLQKGQYQLLILPEIQANDHLLQLTLIVLSNSQICIEKKLYQQSQHILQMACCDISQRNGLFKQLNDSTCNYSYIQKNTGLIIQNINNEKQHGAIAIARSMAGLKSKVQIIPFNLQFCLNEHEINFHKRRYKKTIELLVEPEESYTVVLMMRGGVDEKFLKVFKFES